MTYTRQWDQVLAVPGSRDADEIDDAFRETKVDLTERFAVLVKDVTADPWEPRVGSEGLIRIPAWAGSPALQAVYDPVLGAVRPSAPTDVAPKWFGGLPLVRGAHVKSARFYVYGPSVHAEVKRVNWSTGGAPAVVAAGTSAVIATGPTGIFLDGLDEVISTTNDLYFEVTIPGDGVDAGHTRFYGVEVEVASS